MLHQNTITRRFSQLSHNNQSHIRIRHHQASTSNTISISRNHNITPLQVSRRRQLIKHRTTRHHQTRHINTINGAQTQRIRQKRHSQRRLIRFNQSSPLSLLSISSISQRHNINHQTSNRTNTNRSRNLRLNIPKKLLLKYQVQVKHNRNQRQDGRSNHSHHNRSIQTKHIRQSLQE